MISNIKFDALPKPTPQFIRANPVKAVAYLVGAILIIVLHHIGLLISLLAYLCHGIGRALGNLYRAIMSETDDALGLDESHTGER